MFLLASICHISLMPTCFLPLALIPFFFFHDVFLLFLHSVCFFAFFPWLILCSWYIILHSSCSLLSQIFFIPLGTLILSIRPLNFCSTWRHCSTNLSHFEISRVTIYILILRYLFLKCTLRKCGLLYIVGIQKRFGSVHMTFVGLSL